MSKGMTRWADVEADAAEFAARVRAVFDAGTNKTLATLRADGSPRISGTELVIADGAVTLGMMPGSKKLLDVQRDNRVAIHSPTIEPPIDVAQWVGDAKLAGRLHGRGTEGNGEGFELDITEVVLTTVVDNALQVESWHPGRGYELVTRD